MKTLKFLFALAVLAAVPLSAQVDTATITGVVADPSGAAIAGAGVRATNLATSLAYNTSSNEAGVYVITALPIGRYDVEISSEGFQTVRRPGVTLNSGTRARIDVAMTLGQVTEIIEVTGEVPLLEAETSSLNQVIENKTITQMPLNGRNYQELAMLSAGVLPNRTQNFVEDAFSVNGARHDQNVFTLDGADNNNYFTGVVVASNQVVKPSIDAIQEFKMETHNYGAEFGRGGGAVVQVTTKGGTNELHGTLFEFLRNEKLDANDFFNSGNEQPPFRQNQFGAAIGGPIVKDRMFFFGSYEGTRIREQLTVLSTVPTPAQVGGNFAGVANIFDPATQRPDRSRDAFADNVIPASRMDPVARRMIELYPAPNLPGRVNNFRFNTPRNRDDDKIDWRFDYRVTDKHSIFLRHSYLDYYRLEPGNLPLPASGGNTATRFSKGNTATLNWTAMVSNTVVNEARIAYVRLSGGIDTPTQEQLWREFGFRGTFDREDINGLPLFQPAAYRNIGDRSFAPDPRKQDTRQFVDTVSINRGKHAIKTGVNIRNFVQYTGITNFARGIWAFNGQYTRPVAGANPGAGNSDSIADALLGLTSSAQLSTAIDARRHAYSYETFIQDNWKVSRKLTLNLGLRYENQTQYTEQNDRASNFVVDPIDPNFGNLILVQGDSRRDRSFRQRQNNNFGPRIGFAYQLDDKTVVRSGYGVFYLGNFMLPTNASPHFNPPFYLQTNIPTSVTSADSLVVVRDGFSPGALDPNVLDGRALIAVWPDRYYNGMTNQWNLNIQRTLPWNSLFSIAYVGSNTVHRSETADINQPVPVNLAPGVSLPNRRAFPRFANINMMVPIGNANYQGLEMKYERRFAQGFSILTGYTFSKTLDGEMTQQSSILATQKSQSIQHMPQRFFLASVWDLPFGKGRKWLDSGFVRHIVGGWQISPIFEAQEGLFVTPGVTNNPANTTGGQRPDRIGDPTLPRNQRTPERWYDVSAFDWTTPAVDTRFGNSATNIIQGPGLVNLDLMVGRTFNINERVNLAFRVETFNLTNEAHFNFPNTQVNTPNAGRISSTSSSMRQIQFGLKLNF